MAKLIETLMLAEPACAEHDPKMAHAVAIMVPASRLFADITRHPPKPSTSGERKQIARQTS